MNGELLLQSQVLVPSFASAVMSPEFFYDLRVPEVHYQEVDFPLLLLLVLTVDVFGISSLAGPQECWLLTASRLQLVTAQLKMCLNPHCLALHSFMDIYTGGCLFSFKSSNTGQKIALQVIWAWTLKGSFFF